MSDFSLASLKILFITHAYPDFTGSYRGHLVQRTAHGLRRKEVQVDVLCPRVFQQSPLKETDPRGVRIFRFVYPSGNRMLLSFERIPVFRMVLFYISAFLKGRHLLKKHSYQLIHAHWIVPLGPVAVILGKMFRVPVLIQAHGSDVHTYALRNRILKKLTCFSIGQSRGVLAVSRELGQNLMRMCAVTGREAWFHPPFVDTELFSPRPSGSESASTSEREGPKNLIFAGGLWENKGIIPLLESAEEFLNLRSDLNLLFLGDGPLKEHIRNWTEKQGVETRVSLAGNVPHRDMPEYLRKAHILILPSFREGTPSVLLEALACGVPPIATSVGQIPSIVRHEENGLLVNAGSAEAITKAVKRLLEDPHLYAKLKENGPKSVRDYGIGPATDRLLGFYRRVIRF